MDAIFNRYRSYRSLVVLVVVVMAQVLYLAYQVRTNRDERLIRVWAVSAVTPMAGIVEATRHNTIGFLKDYFLLLDVRDQNRRLKRDNDQLRMENVFYRNQLATAEHARALTLFQAKTPSRTVAARVIGDSTVSTAKAVFIDRGSTSGIEKGMAVVTPDGIVGKVAAVYPLVSQVLLVTDSTFKVGVESQKGHIHGTLNCGIGHCVVEQIQNEEDVAPGEWFFTSGEDRIFPKGFPVGTVLSAAPGNGMKEVRLALSGAPSGVEEVLVVLDGEHQPIPTGVPAEEKMAKPLPPPPPDDKVTSGAQPGAAQTEADKLVQKYQQLGKEQDHVYGAMYSNMPDFASKPTPKAPAPPPGVAVTPTANRSTTPLGSGPVLGSPLQPAAPGPIPRSTAASAQSQSPAPAVKPPAAHAPGSKPALPLGSPRPKSTADGNTHGASQTTPPANTSTKPPANPPQ
jgi:rod shape-determining protein MreC